MLSLQPSPSILKLYLEMKWETREEPKVNKNGGRTLDRLSDVKKKVRIKSSIDSLVGLLLITWSVPQSRLGIWKNS